MKPELSQRQRNRLLRTLTARQRKHKIITRCNGACAILDLVAIALLNQSKNMNKNTALTLLCIGAIFAIVTIQIISEAKQKQIQEQITKLRKANEK